jgi:hypothetical protein
MKRSVDIFHSFLQTCSLLHSCVALLNLMHLLVSLLATRLHHEGIESLQRALARSL